MTYRVVIKPSARKELEALPDVLLRRVDRAIVNLGEEPRPRGAVKLRMTDLLRIRVGAHRIVYCVDDRERVVEIMAIDHRRDVYR